MTRIRGTFAMVYRFAGLLFGLVALTTSAGAAEPVAKKQFGSKPLPAVLQPAAHGFYSKGCLAGGIAIPNDGPTWQTMRPNRNRRWGHPDTIKTVVQLSKDAKANYGWNGLMVGDISQPRGGPMLTGHASHQLGLDADIWLTEMPDRRLTPKERVDLSATTTLRQLKDGRIDQTKIGPHFTKKTFGLIKTAASYPQVERVLVHPTVKEQLCKLEKGSGRDRSWLYKVRPYWGHHYHMHVRLSCPAGSPNCRPQKKPLSDDGCGSELQRWAKLFRPPSKNPPPPPKTTKKAPPPKKKREISVSELPPVCRAVLNAPQPVTAQAAELRIENGVAFAPEPSSIPSVAVAQTAFAGERIAVPTFRPQEVN